MSKTEADRTLCYLCNRGGRGNDPDLCSAGWRVTTSNGLGCFLGTPIVGTPREPEKISRSKARYQRFLDMDIGVPFGEFIRKGWYKEVRS